MTGGRGRGGRCVVKRRIWGAVEEKRSLEEFIQMVERIVEKDEGVDRATKRVGQDDQPTNSNFHRFSWNKYV